MRILFFTDTHNGDRTPRMRKASYTEDILAKQVHLTHIARDHNVDIVIHGGDLFNDKFPGKTSHSLVRRLMEIYRGFPKVLIVPGNHDFDSSVDQLETSSPFAVFRQLPNVEVIFNRAVIEDELIIYGMGGGDYYEPKTHLLALNRFADKYLDEHKFKLAVLHASVTNKAYPFDTIHVNEVLMYADFFLFGHLHDWVDVNLKGGYASPGSISRGVLKLDSSLNRRPQCVLLEFESNVLVSVDTIPVNHRPADEVFTIEVKKHDNKVKKSVESFVSMIENLQIPRALKLEDYLEYLDNMDAPKDVKNKAKEILRSV